VDNDDYILPAMYERLYINAALLGHDIIKCGFYTVVGELAEPFPCDEADFLDRYQVQVFDYASQEIPAQDILRYQALNLLDRSVWTLLIRTDVAKQTFFRGSRLEDWHYNMDLAQNSKSMLILPERYYLYMQRADSLSRRLTLSDYLAYAHSDMLLFEKLISVNAYDCLSYVFNRGLRVFLYYQQHAERTEEMRSLFSSIYAHYHDNFAQYYNKTSVVYTESAPYANYTYCDKENRPLPLREAVLKHKRTEQAGESHA
jgi:hypothetical protein